MPLIWYTARKKPLEKAGLNFDYSDIIKSRFQKNEIKDSESDAETKESESEPEIKEGEPDDNN
jgi:hypothetical protein